MINTVAGAILVLVLLSVWVLVRYGKRWEDDEDVY